MWKGTELNIRNPNAFQLATPANFDGVFDWDFLCSAFPGKIEPTDIDANVEINGHVLRFETKTPGYEIPLGQRRFICADLVKYGRHVTWLLLTGKQSRDLKSATMLLNEKRTLRAFVAHDPISDRVYSLCKAWADYAKWGALPSRKIELLGFMELRPSPAWMNEFSRYIKVYRNYR